MWYDFGIKYKPRMDALSRQKQYATITIVHYKIWKGLEEEMQGGNEKLKRIVQDLLSDSGSHSGLVKWSTRKTTVVCRSQELT